MEKCVVLTEDSLDLLKSTIKNLLDISTKYRNFLINLDDTLLDKEITEALIVHDPVEGAIASAILECFDKKDYTFKIM